MAKGSGLSDVVGAQTTEIGGLKCAEVGQWVNCSPRGGGSPKLFESKFRHT